MKVIILSCSRSGSAFTSRFLCNNGLKFGHEKILKNGGIGWKIGIHPSMSYQDKIFWNKVMKQTVIHQVRNPLKFFNTVRTHNRNVRRTIKKSLNISANSYLEFAMKYWLSWNILCQKYSEWSYRVEDITYNSETTNKLMSYFGLKEYNNIPKTNTNTRLHKKRAMKKEYIIDDMYRENSQLAHHINSLATEFGYNLR